MSSRQVVNLCFHGIGTPRRDLEEGESGYWIGEDTFQRVLDVVAERDDVRLSFDDGNLSDLDIGLPALAERGLEATFFVLAGRLGSSGSLDEDAVRELARGGMTIGSHGMDHVPWRGLDPATSRRELVEARDTLEEVTGARVDHAALPLGRYDRALLGRLRALGYRQVHTSDRRWAREGGWIQPRFSLRADDSVESLREHVLRPAGPVQRAKLQAKGLAKTLR